MYGSIVSTNLTSSRRKSPEFSFNISLTSLTELQKMFQFVFNKNGLEGILILLNVGALFKPEIMKNGCVHLNLAI